jgi:hypothetical protein
MTGRAIRQPNVKWLDATPETPRSPVYRKQNRARPGLRILPAADECRLLTLLALSTLIRSAPLRSPLP